MLLPTTSANPATRASRAAWCRCGSAPRRRRDRPCDRTGIEPLPFGETAAADLVDTIAAELVTAAKAAGLDIITGELSAADRVTSLRTSRPRKAHK